MLHSHSLPVLWRRNLHVHLPDLLSLLFSFPLQPTALPSRSLQSRGLSEVKHTELKGKQKRSLCTGEGLSVTWWLFFLQLVLLVFFSTYFSFFSL